MGVDQFLTVIYYPPVLMTGADALQIFWNLFFEFSDDVCEANAQGLGYLGAGQNSRGTVMAFNKTDRGTADADLIGKRLVREALLLAEPGKFINDLFNQ